MNYNFIWDVNKAKSNYFKHMVSFKLAATVFKDPNALSLYDYEHVDFDDRWITIGKAVNGQIILLEHGFNYNDDLNIEICIYSASKVTKKDIKFYKNFESIMKEEYDFSVGERGKFYNPEAELKIPIYLEKGVQDFNVEQAENKKILDVNKEKTTNL